MSTTSTNAKSATTPPDYDAIIVGAGATGQTAAETLARAGMRVLVLDAGPQHDAPADGPNATRPAPHARTTPAAAAHDATDRQPVQRRHMAFGEATRSLFVDDIDNPYTTPGPDETDAPPFAWIRMRGTGGRLRLWVGHVPRMEERDFRAASHDGFGVDWPIGEAELRPYYEQIETLLGVRDARSSGVTPSAAAAHLEARIAATFADRRMQHARIAPCPETGDHRAAVGILDRAMAIGRVTLETDAIARRVVLDRSGSAAGVVVVDTRTGREREIAGRRVLLCASTVETVRLLLNSADARHPEGLGTPDVLGRYFMDHTAGIRLDGLVPGVPGYEPSRHLVGAGIYVPRFRNVSPSDRHPRFIRGYGIQGVVGPVVTDDDLHALPGDFEANVAAAKAGRPSGFSLMSFGETLARPESTITVDPTVQDRWGIPAARIDLRYGDNELAMADDTLTEMRAIAACAGFEVLAERTELLAPGLSLHELGGARMGAEPKTSVVGPNNEVWGVPNLFVTDGACFPSGGCQNPTLTMMAITARACDAIAARWKRETL